MKPKTMPAIKLTRDKKGHFTLATRNRVVRAANKFGTMKTVDATGISRVTIWKWKQNALKTPPSFNQ